MIIFLREHEKKTFNQIFFLFADFVALKLNYVCTYVLWYSDLFSKYVVKRVFTFSLTARHLVKAHQFQLCICYVKSIPNNRFSWILSPICVKNTYLVNKWTDLKFVLFTVLEKVWLPQNKNCNFDIWHRLFTY